MFVSLESFVVDVLIHTVKQQQLELLHSLFLLSDIIAVSVAYSLYKTWAENC